MDVSSLRLLVVFSKEEIDLAGKVDSFMFRVVGFRRDLLNDVRGSGMRFKDLTEILGDNHKVREGRSTAIVVSLV